MSHRTLPTFLAVLITAGLCAQHEQKPARDGKTIPEVAAAAGGFTTLLAAVQAAGLADTLAGKGPFTVFAPTDAAFEKLGKAALAELLLPANKSKLTAILTYHVAGADLPAAKVIASREIPTLQGQPLPVLIDGDVVMLGGAKVVKTDVRASNGVIHVIDAVLVPPAGAQPGTEPAAQAAAQDIVAVAKAAGQFQTLLKAASAAGLAETLAKDGPFTVFAPTDAAFKKLGDDVVAKLLQPGNEKKLAAVLRYHVVAGRVPAAQARKLERAATLQGQELRLQAKGDALTVDGANVVKPDVPASNGIIHVIDAVLLPRE